MGQKHTIGILGGTGFVGQHLCAKLANYPGELLVFTRRPDLYKDLTVLPNLKLVALDIHDPIELARGLENCDVVINLVGILNENRKATFQKVHVELVRNLINICQQKSIERLLHISALNADPKGPSEYLRSKGMAEQLLNQANGLHFHTTIFQPSVIFGPGDHFFNQFAHLLKMSPGIMLLPCADSLYAPVYVEDVVQAIVTSIGDKRAFAKTYQVCGPEVFSLHELVKMTAYTIEKKRLIIGLGPKLSNFAAHILQYFPGKPLTPDNYLSTTLSSVCKTALPDYFNIQMQTIHNILPNYLGKFALVDPYALFRKFPPGE